MLPNFHAKLPNKLKIKNLLLQARYFIIIRKKIFLIFVLLLFCSTILIIHFIGISFSNNSTKHPAPSLKKSLSNLEYSTVPIHQSSTLHNPFTPEHAVNESVSTNDTETNNIIESAEQKNLPAVNIKPQPDNSLQLTGIIISDNHKAIIKTQNTYYTVSAGNNFISYFVLAIDDDSVQLRNETGEISVYYLDSFSIKDGNSYAP
ncbi:hypothetical protein [Pectinatus frisingensis]|uniref:hypothetical protein n=1 Tax=Pectinatus frisingensis TaxID=865 RepID=UPI0018C5DAF4|nr:hypothetical protein [Pectinatus frisingensis]